MDLNTDKWYFDPERPDDVPQFMKETLVSINVAPPDVVLFFRTDMDNKTHRCDNYVAVTKNEIVTLAGITTTVASYNVFTMTHHQKFDFSQFEDFKLEELLSTARLLGITKDGATRLIANLTFGSKSVAHCAMKYLIQFQKSGVINPEPDVKVDERGKYCPKCGNRYADAELKMCPKCLDRKKIMQRSGFFMKKHKRSLMWTLFAMLLSSGLALIGPFLHTTFFYNEVLNTDGSSIFGMSFYRNMALLLAVIVSVRIVGVFVDIVHRIIFARVAAKISYDLKNTIFGCIQRLSVSFFSSKQTGGLMTQVNEDAGTINWFLSSFIAHFITAMIQVVVVLIILLIFNPLLTLITVLIFPVAFLVIRFAFERMDKLHKRRWTKQRTMNGTLVGVLSGIRVVKAFAREESENQRYAKRSRDVAEAGKAAILNASMLFPTINFILSLANILVLGIGGWMVITGNMEFGILIGFMAYTGFIFGPIFMFVDMIYNVSDSMAAMNRLVEIMDAKPEVIESENPVLIDAYQGEVEFRNVDFSYVENKKVLDAINFKIEPGKIIGIVGKTGAGKSTIANLILRLYDVTEGEIFIDGHNIKELSTADLHRNIAIVSQETYLFLGTIADNIRYAKPDATFDEVVAAAKMSSAHDFIIKLPAGYQTMIGPGYKDLSGGERQRVSIARTLLRDPKILVLDEATAAMDTETERNIQSALEKLYAGRTTIMIAHRLSTLRDADRLLVIDKGKVVESGSHAELIDKEGTYHKLYTLQLEALKTIGVTE